ncbi:MAG: tripartite tricarboxylate transporter substrate binding protein [Betaproteobacteria bacterium]|nr:tripartite tricarboxylate transporter substrate binding protein [Betaproteobacteria bacterium]
MTLTGIYLGLTAALAAFFAGAACAQGAYPAKTVKIVVPFAAGGPADIFARVLGERLEKALGQAFIVEDRPGGGAIIGTDAVAKSEPDGYTLLMMSNTHTVSESLFTKKPYSLMRDLVPVSPVNYSDLLLVVHPSVPAKNLGELVALAKSKPGALNYASSGPGTPYHMAGELFKAMAGVNIVHVPHKGSSQARASVMSGDVQMMIDAITTMAPIARSGKVRAIASTGKSRSDIMPEMPTLDEAGVPGYDAVIWLGVMAPAATPRPVVERLNGDIQKIMKVPELKEAWAKQGATPIYMGSPEFGRFLQQDIEKWAKVVKASGAKVD